MKNQFVFKRHEMKYLVSNEERKMIEKAMEGHMVPDKHGKNTLFSLYLDTDDFLLIRRSIDKPMYKEKLRLRSYGLADADSDVFLEIKKKYDGVVYKRRIKVTEQEALNYFDGTKGLKDSQVSREIQWANDYYGGLKPAMLLMYDRAAYYDEYDSDFRVTFDDNIKYRTKDLNLHTGFEGQAILPEGYSLMEIKTSKSIPLWMVKVLSDNKIYKTSFSKYGTAYKMVYKSPELSNVLPAKVNINVEEKGILNYA